MNDMVFLVPMVAGLVILFTATKLRAKLPGNRTFLGLAFLSFVLFWIGSAMHLAYDGKYYRTLDFLVVWFTLFLFCSFVVAAFPSLRPITSTKPFIMTMLFGTLALGAGHVIGLTTSPAYTRGLLNVYDHVGIHSHYLDKAPHKATASSSPR